ncbi:MAG: hypothetical protein M3430_03965 [Acidobacteriota bacterium]|nr:hypothetical protein [Acidobacteriota bacterium]
MTKAANFLMLFLALTLTHSLALRAHAQTDAATASHQIEGRLQFRAGRVGNVRVRLLKLPDARPIAETFSRPEGQFTFGMVTEGEYVVETFETERFDATSANVSARPVIRGRPTTFNVLIELPLKASPAKTAAGVVAADVDVDVPKAALKHYHAGMKAIEKRDSARVVTELQAAIEIYPKYYAARLELGRELRLQKRFLEATEILQPLNEIAPRRIEPRVERGVVLLALERRAEAVSELQAALSVEESNWTAHLYLGWALLDQDGEKAGTHLRRALELNEQKAARAHLALAQLADAKGQRRLAVEHLDAYLALAPDAHDAEATRKLAERLRSEN